MRMLMNNLDPEVAEHPDELVVYGGTGRAARSWEAFDAIVASLRTLERRRDAARPVGQAGRRVPHARVVAAGADRQLEPGARVGDLGRVPPARGARADDVRPDDGRLVDLHRQPGDRAGHLRVLRGDRAPAARRLAGGHDLADRRARRDGRRAAARGHDERRRRAVRRGRPRARSSGGCETRYLDELADSLDDAVARCARGQARAARALSVGLEANAADVLPDAAAARLRGRHRHRPDERARPARTATCPNTMTLDEALALRRVRPRASTCSAPARAMAAHCAAMVGFMDAGSEVFDYGNTCAPRRVLGGFERAFDYPGFVPAYIRPLFCEGRGPFRWVALSGDPADIAATDRAVLEEFPDDEALARWIAHAVGADRVPGAAGADLLARLRRARAARAAVQRDGRVRRAEGADRDRPRPPRLRLGRLPLPRDRGDGRRLRRDRRLAAAERAREHRRRARRGSRSTTAAASGSAARSTPGWCASPTGPSSPPQKLERVLTTRPGDGRDPPRRRGLRASGSRSPPSAACGSRCARTRERSRRSATRCCVGARCRRCSHRTSSRTPETQALIDDLIETRARRRRRRSGGDPDRRVASGSPSSRWTRQPALRRTSRRSR